MYASKADFMVTFLDLCSDGAGLHLLLQSFCQLFRVFSLAPDAYSVDNEETTKTHPPTAKTDPSRN